MFSNAGVSLADIAAVTGNNRNNDGFGDGGWWAWIIIFALFGWGGNGFGFGGGNNGQLTEAAMQRGFDTNTIVNKLDGLANGLCDSTYALNNSIQQGNFGLQTAVMQGFNAVQSQAAECCCQTQRAIDQVRYDMATDTCAIRTDMNQGFAMLDRTINDKFCELEMRQMQQTINEQASLIQSLNLAASQANQNQYLISQLRPAPEPAYVVPNPYASYGYGYNGGCGCGTNWNNGCGCSC